MKILIGILLGIIAIVGVFLLLLLLGIGLMSYRNRRYWNFVKTSQPIEENYTALGKYDVSCTEFKTETDTCKKYGI